MSFCMCGSKPHISSLFFVRWVHTTGCAPATPAAAAHCCARAFCSLWFCGSACRSAAHTGACHHRFLLPFYLPVRAPLVPLPATAYILLSRFHTMIRTHCHYFYLPPATAAAHHLRACHLRLPFTFVFFSHLPHRALVLIRTMVLHRCVHPFPHACYFSQLYAFLPRHRFLHRHHYDSSPHHHHRSAPRLPLLHWTAPPPARTVVSPLPHLYVWLGSARSACAPRTLLFCVTCTAGIGWGRSSTAVLSAYFMLLQTRLPTHTCAYHHHTHTQVGFAHHTPFTMPAHHPAFYLIPTYISFHFSSPPLPACIPHHHHSLPTSSHMPTCSLAVPALPFY